MPTASKSLGEGAGIISCFVLKIAFVQGAQDRLGVFLVWVLGVIYVGSVLRVFCDCSTSYFEVLDLSMMSYIFVSSTLAKIFL